MMHLRSSARLEQADSSASKAEETMQEDNYSTQAVWGSPQSQSPEDHHQSPSPPIGEAGPSNPAPGHFHRGQQSYPKTHHSGTDFLLYDSWRNDSADDCDYEERQRIYSQSPHTHSRSDPEPYETSNSGSQAPPAVPSPPPNDYGYAAGNEKRHHSLAPVQTSPPIQRYTQGREAWSPAAPMSAEERREMLTEDIPDLLLDSKRNRGDDDKMEKDLSKLVEGGKLSDEERRRKRPRGTKRASSPDYRKGKGRDRDSDRDRRGGQQGAGRQ